VLLGAGFAGVAIAVNLPNARLRTRSMPLSKRRARRACPFLAARRPPWMRRACSHACLAATLDASPRAPSAAWRAVVGAHPRAAAAVATTPTRLSA